MPLNQSKQRLNDRYDDAGFYGWSEDKARQVATPERETFGEYVKRQNFKLT